MKKSSCGMASFGYLLTGMVVVVATRSESGSGI
jgi:hypothetical protein